METASSDKGLGRKVYDYLWGQKPVGRIVDFFENAGKTYVGSAMGIMDEMLTLGGALGDQLPETRRMFSSQKRTRTGFVGSLTGLAAITASAWLITKATINTLDIAFEASEPKNSIEVYGSDGKVSYAIYNASEEDMKRFMEPSTTRNTNLNENVEATE